MGVATRHVEHVDWAPLVFRSFDVRLMLGKLRASASPDRMLHKERGLSINAYER